jgi:hypothetical protein
LELVINGLNIITDPGTYLYTPIIKKRNEFRSVKAHFSPSLADLEPGNLSLNAFKLSDPKAEVIYFGSDGFIGKHYGYGFAVYRQITFSPSEIVINDFSDGFKLSFDAYQQPQFSPGYGIIYREKMNSYERWVLNNQKGSS